LCIIQWRTGVFIVRWELNLVFNVGYYLHECIASDDETSRSGGHRYDALVCRRLIAGIGGWNPAEGWCMDVRRLLGAFAKL
jgi:hypothetical protein